MRVLWLVIGFWTLSTFSSLAWNIVQDYREMQGVALAEARSHIKKDMAFRSWISSHGGVYVRPTDEIVPDSDIAFLSDRDLRTTDGELLTLIHPVNGARQIDAYFSEPFDIKSRTVSFRSYDHGEKPDAWEAEALDSLDRGVEEAFTFSELEGQPVLRVLWPARAEAHCLKCHAQEGFHVGDILGGVGITLPLAPRMIQMERHVFKEVAVYVSLWVLGLCGIGFGWHRFRNWLRFRRYADSQLREREELFRGLSEQSPNMIFISLYGRVVYGNNEMARIIGCKPDELLESNVDVKSFLAPVSREAVLEHFKRRMSGEEVLPVECTVVDSLGREIQGIVAVTPIPYKGKVAVLGTITDITAQKGMEASISHSLHEKEVLLQEIHHRVKNNLQVISSLLSLQAASMTNPDVLEVFSESERRIRSMAAVHEQLYQSKNLSVINAAEYIRSVVEDVYSSYNSNAHIELHTELEPIDFSLDTAIPCGLIVNELVSNALKYAFPKDGGGRVSVTLRGIPATGSEGHRAELSVCDNGVGLPKGMDIRKTDSLGLQLVTSLCERQLRGRLDAQQNGGTCFYLQFNV